MWASRIGGELVKEPLHQIWPPCGYCEEPFFGSQAGVEKTAQVMVHRWKTCLQELTDRPSTCCLGTWKGHRTFLSGWDVDGWIWRWGWLPHRVPMRTSSGWDSIHLPIESNKKWLMPDTKCHLLALLYTEHVHDSSWHNIQLIWERLHPLHPHLRINQAMSPESEIVWVSRNSVAKVEWTYLFCHGFKSFRLQPERLPNVQVFQRDLAYLSLSYMGWLLLDTSGLGWYVLWFSHRDLHCSAF